MPMVVSNICPSTAAMALFLMIVTGHLDHYFHMLGIAGSSMCDIMISHSKRSEIFCFCFREDDDLCPPPDVMPNEL